MYEVDSLLAIKERIRVFLDINPNDSYNFYELTTFAARSLQMHHRQKKFFDINIKLIEYKTQAKILTREE